MRWSWPSEETRTKWEFVFNGMKALAIVGAAIWALWTYTQNSIEQREAVRRELRKPYDEKQLAIYLEAARVVAHLASMPNASDKEATEKRFWELYWGELAFVESQISVTDNSVESLMVTFCQGYFGMEKCHSKPETDIQNALLLARQASYEVKSVWDKKAAAPPLNTPREDTLDSTAK